MSTPTINSAATQGLARVVTDLEHQVRNTPRPSGPPDLSEVLALAENMRVHASENLTPVLDRLWAASEAIDQTLVDIDTPAPPANLLDLDADQVAAKFLEAAQTRAATMLDPLGYSPSRRAWEAFTAALAHEACAALTDAADDVVKTLRRDFDKHVNVITAAAEAGLSEHTDTTDLLSNGTDAQITAYRALPGATAALDQIAGLRNQLTGVLRYGPPIHPAYSFVTGLASSDAAESAAIRYDGAVETVQYNAAQNASTLTRVHVQRLGGRWLALAAIPGVTLRLNTAAEVQDQYDGLTR
jgi:hypothetical protein